MRNWSHYQQAIFDEVVAGSGHAVARARAGCAKTTTAVEAMARTPQRERSLFCAFNRSVAQELQARAPRRASVSTLHAYGYRAIRKNMVVEPEVDDNKTAHLLADKTEVLAKDVPMIRRLCSLAKAEMIPTWQQMGSSQIRALEDAAASRDLDLPESDFERERMLHKALWLVEKSVKDRKRVDYDDMVYWPARFDKHIGFDLPRFDRVFIDEVQDLSTAQLALAIGAVAEGGRVLGLGDDRQAIYGWRGADSQAMSRIVKELDAKILPLPRTYRCGKSIVELARKFVPDFEADEGNPRGDVQRCSWPALPQWIRPGDFLLSRTNAPLIATCMHLLQTGMPAHVVGRDFGANLVALCDRSKQETAANLRMWLADYEAKSGLLLKEKGREQDAVKLADRTKSLAALCGGVQTVAEVKQRIRAIFDDRHDGERVACSSVHRAKGLERDRVFMLVDTFFREKGDATEEENLYYVAVTRARHTLYLVEGLP